MQSGHGESANENPRKVISFTGHKTGIERKKGGATGKRCDSFRLGFVKRHPGFELVEWGNDQ